MLTWYNFNEKNKVKIWYDFGKVNKIKIVMTGSNKKIIKLINYSTSTWVRKINVPNLLIIYLINQINYFTSLKISK